MATGRCVMPVRSSSARPRLSTAIWRKTFSHCVGAGSTAGSRVNTTASTTSRRSAFLLWAALRAGATATADWSMAGDGEARARGRCRRPVGPHSTFIATTALPPHRRRPPRRRSITPFDPHQPMPTLGGAISSGEPVMRAGTYDHAAIAERRDGSLRRRRLTRSWKSSDRFPSSYGSLRMPPTPISPQSCSMFIRRAPTIRTALR